MSQSFPIAIDSLNIRTPKQLKARAQELGGIEYIIEGLIPKQSISLLVGDSGLGKSPLLYQAAISVAAGIPFLGKEVRQGPVLFMDAENGIAQVAGMISGLSSFLGLKAAPEDLRVWNLNDAPGFGEKGNQLEDMIREVRPIWVIIDPINSVFNDIEQEATVATQHLQSLRALMARYQCSFTGVHHVRKPSDNPKEKPRHWRTRNWRPSSPVREEAGF
jgi:RecA-family ATPase